MVFRSVHLWYSVRFICGTVKIDQTIVLPSSVLSGSESESIWILLPAGESAYSSTLFEADSHYAAIIDEKSLL